MLYVAVAQQDTVEPPVSQPLATENCFILPRAHHSWTKFDPLAWRDIRTTAETFDSDGKVASRSVTSQTEILKAISEDSYSIDVQATVDLAGKLIKGKWQSRQYHMLTDNTAHIDTMRKLKPGNVTIGEQTICCDVWELAARDEQSKYLQRVFYARNQWPFILQREISELPDQPKQDLLSTQTNRVVALAVPYVVAGESVSCSCVRVEHRSNKGTTVRMELRAENVPGGIVAAWTTDADARRLPIRWSLVELVDFGTTERVE